MYKIRSSRQLTIIAPETDGSTNAKPAEDEVGADVARDAEMCEVCTHCTVHAASHGGELVQPEKLLSVMFYSQFYKYFRVTPGYKVRCAGTYTYKTNSFPPKLSLIRRMNWPVIYCMATPALCANSAQHLRYI